MECHAADPSGVARQGVDQRAGPGLIELHRWVRDSAGNRQQAAVGAELHCPRRARMAAHAEQLPTASRQIPDLRRQIPTHRYQPVAFATEGDTEDQVVVALEAKLLPVRDEVPD